MLGHQDNKMTVDGEMVITGKLWVCATQWSCGTCLLVTRAKTSVAIDFGIEWMLDLLTTCCSQTDGWLSEIIWEKKKKLGKWDEKMKKRKRFGLQAMENWKHMPIWGPTTNFDDGGAQKPLMDEMRFSNCNGWNLKLTRMGHRWTGGIGQHTLG